MEVPVCWSCFCQLSPRIPKEGKSENRIVVRVLRLGDTRIGRGIANKCKNLAFQVKGSKT